MRLRVRETHGERMFACRMQRAFEFKARLHAACKHHFILRQPCMAHAKQNRTQRRLACDMLMRIELKAGLHAAGKH